MPTKRIKRFVESLGFYNLEFANPKGKKGGIVVGWKLRIDLEISTKWCNMINGLVFSDPVNEPWMISFVYESPNRNNKGPFWEVVEKVGDAFSGGWLCISDFNHVFSQADKKGRRPVAESSDGGPSKIIEKNCLIDLQFFGNPYTRSNRRDGLANIKERLDRAFANDRWRIIFPRATIQHLAASTSDHSPIILSLKENKSKSKDLLNLKRCGQGMKPTILLWKVLGGYVCKAFLCSRFVKRLRKQKMIFEEGTKNGLVISKLKLERNESSLMRPKKKNPPKKICREKSVSI